MSEALEGITLSQLAEAEDLRRGCWQPVEVKAVNEDAREILHLITTNSRDRMDDMVEAKGARLQNYRKNPVVLANHDYSIESVIGRSLAIESAEDGLYARTRFMDTPLADAAFRLAAEKLGGWSIGFRPLKRHTIKQGKEQKCKRCAELFDQLADGKGPGDYIPDMWGLHFTEWELLEYSSVAIPANQDVVNNAVTRGLCPQDLAGKFFRLDDSPRREQSPGSGPTAEAGKQDRPRVVVPESIRLRAESVLRAHRRRVALHEAHEQAAQIVRDRE